MGRKRVYQTEQDRRKAQTERRSMARRVRPHEFIGVDGEGIGRWQDHKYVLIGVGTEQIENPDGLEFTEIMRFLYSQFLLHPDAVFCGFFLGYDFTQWLRSLPEDRARMLLTDAGIVKRSRKSSGGNRTPFPVRYQGWEFDILGMKRFKLRPATDDTGKARNYHRWMYVNDAGSFFQTSFLSAIDPARWTEPVCTQETYSLIKQGKEKRDSAILDSDMRRYNILENVVLSSLLCRLDQGFMEAGIRLKKDQWFGPGQAAQEWLNKYGSAPKTADLGRMAEALELGRKTYYGGWFEIFAHGHIRSTACEYDINSAYPFIASRLPCLLHGSWTRYENRIPGNGLCIVRASVSGSDPHCGSMLHRIPNGSILRPHATTGYYWLGELEAARRAGIIDTIDVIESWEYIAECDCRAPLRGLAGLYDKRLRIGKDTAAGKAYKLVYNSVYGKFAQSVGNPRYGNSLYASLITSGCRTMILDAIATHPERTGALLMVATDGVYFTSPHPGLAISEQIGDWSVSIKQNLCLFKPGVYWDDDARERIASGSSPGFKSRGISARSFAQCIGEIDNHFRQWGDSFPAERDPMGPRDGWYPRVTFKTGFSMITAVQALQRGKWFLAGRVSDNEVTQDADPIGKRHSGWHDPVTGIYWSQPYPNGGWEAESTPYDKRFGAPDPDEYGITPDGTVLDEIAWMLR